MEENKSVSVHKNKTDVGMELEMANVAVGGWMEIGRRPKRDMSLPTGDYDGPTLPELLSRSAPCHGK